MSSSLLIKESVVDSSGGDYDQFLLKASLFIGEVSRNFPSHLLGC